MLRSIKAAIPEPVRRLIRGPDRLSTSEALARIAARGVDIATVIDVGASDGHWSAIAQRFWPRAKYHLIEAFDHWLPKLTDITARDPRYSYVLAAAGPREGTTTFTLGNDAYGGSAAHACYRRSPQGADGQH
jgi:hypothetical protein